MRTWTEDETAVLLAWLDFCIEQKLDFRETIANRLAEDCESSALSTEALSWKKAEQKLIDLARTNRGRTAIRLAAIKDEGSKCILGLKDSIKQKIRTNFQQYQRDVSRRATVDCAPVQYDTSNEQSLKTTLVNPDTRPQIVPIAATNVGWFDCQL